METKFTKGEWKTYRADDYWNYIYVGDSWGSLPNLVATVEKRDSDEEEIANANLLSSAPDMANMLQKIIESQIIEGTDLNDEVKSILQKAIK